MIRIAPKMVRLSTDWDQSIWAGDWLLVYADLHRPGFKPSRNGVVGFHPDGRCEKAVLAGIERNRSLQVEAYTLVTYPEDTRGMPLSQVRARTREVGVCFAPKYGNPIDVVRTEPLRSVRRLPHPDAVPRRHSAAVDAGDVSVSTADHYAKYPANKWITNGHRRALAAAFAGVGKNGFVVFNRETGGLRAIDLGEPVVRVEVRADGLMAAAILKDNAVAFVDLGDD